MREVPMKARKKQSLVVDILIWGFLIVTALLILAPTLFMFTASLMPSRDIVRMPYPWIPKDLYVQNYWHALEGNDGNFIYPRNILNSFIVAGSVSLTTVLISALTGYGLAKFPFRGRNIVFLLIMATMMIPFEAIMIPLYLVATTLKMQDSYLGLIMPFLTNAFGIFLMRQYMLTFPDEIIDAARIDGSGELSIFWRIILPNSTPAVAALAILTFRTQWDNLLWPLLISQSEEMKTIPLYVVKFAAEKHTNEGAMMAAAAIASIPIFILFLLLSKYFVSGALLHSSRKG